jgi:DNA-directed RNA polymerase subunit F|tara:strand:+ start:44 stop:379 length:336 start_codon:yes stop_codon:yes gene_type:complete
MAEIEIIKEYPLTYPEVAEKLKKIKSELGELEFRAKKAEEFLEIFGKEEKEVKLQKEKLNELKIQRLKGKQITQLVNISPTDEDSIKSILATDNITLKQEDIKKIVDCLKQ